MQLDKVAIGFEPFFSFVIQPMRGCVVDYEKNLPSLIGRDKLFEERKEGGTVEHGREPIVKCSSAEIHSTKNVSSLPLTEGIYTRLLADPRPCLMQCAVKPEARFVFEQHDAAACSRFFFIARNLLVTHISCFSASARANRFRGR